MIRNLKALGLATIAVLAMSAFAASTAQAVKLTTESGKYPATIRVPQTTTHEFVVNSRTLTCATGEAVGQITEPSSTGGGTATIENCHTIVFGSTWPITVTMNGCTGTVHSTPDRFTIGCPEGKNGEFHVYSSHANHTSGVSVCTYHLPPQTFTQGFTYENQNKGSGKGTVRLNISSAPVTIKRTSGSAITCGAEHQTGSYTGVSEVTATVGGSPAGIHFG